MRSIKHSPKSLNEWTLEQNILNELTRMFDSPFGFLYPIRLRSIFDIAPFDISRLRSRKTKTYKLTPREEGTGGGWDTKFTIPNNSEKDSRVLYLQIKSGKHSNGNNIKGSLFNVEHLDPNRHIEFTFNDNGKKGSGSATQHNDLTALAQLLSRQGVSGKPVLYAFPRVTTLEQFNRIDKLIYYTTFLSIKEMEDQAMLNKVNLGDGELHHFRTCYIDEQKREISSTPFELEQNDESSDLIAEIMMVKVCHIWNMYYPKISGRRLREYLSISLATELQINPYELNIENRLTRYFDSYQLEEYFTQLSDERKGLERTLFNTDGINEFNRRKIFTQVQSFITEMAGNMDINHSVPRNFTTPISEINNNTNEIGDIQFSEGFEIATFVF